MTKPRSGLPEGQDGLRQQIKTDNRARRKALAASAKAGPLLAHLRNDVLPTLEIVQIAVASLRASGRRLRKIETAHVEEVARSISGLGFTVPVLIDAADVIVDGGVRLEAARVLGLATIPCIRVGHLSATEQRLLRLAVNRLAEKGKWDLAELKFELEELVLADAPLDLSGFGLDEIDQIVILGDDDTVRSRAIGARSGRPADCPAR